MLLVSTFKQAGVQPWSSYSESWSMMLTTRRERFPAWALLPTVDLFRDIKKMILRSVVPFFLFMFAVSYISKERDTASDLGADFLYPHLSTYRYSTPSWKLNGSTAPCECRAEGKAVPSFYLQSNKHYSVMSYTEKNVCCGSVVSPSDTCSSHENARLRLTFLRLTIMSWMETAIRSEFPHATKIRYRLRKGRRGRIVFHASVRSRGIYLHFRSHTLQGLSRQITSAAAIHRTHNSNPTI